MKLHRDAPAEMTAPPRFTTHGPPAVTWRSDLARLAVDDMQLVLRIWPYGPLSPLTWMKALVALLTPPAPKWTATEEPE